MATKKRKAPTKKDLEAKIAELEAKLAKISSQAETTKKAPPPPPKPAETKDESKPSESPKPAEKKAETSVTLAQALENAWQNLPMSNTHDYKKKVTGFSPSPNRYYGRLIAPVGKAPTQDWNLQKAKVTGYTQPSNQYFATRARLAYHPADKNFTGYGFVVEGAETQAQQAPPPPPPAEPEPQQQTQQTTASGGSKQSDLEAYEKDYLARLEQEAKEQDELMKAAAELAAKRKAESGGSSGQASSSPNRGSLPKGF